MIDTKKIRDIANDDALMEIARKTIEIELMEWRDSRRSSFNRRNGLVINEIDGTRSNIIRFGSETAMRIGLLAIADAIDSLRLSHG